MEQLNNYKWYRFPILVTNKRLFESLNGNVPEEEWEMSYVDIREDSVVSIRPYIDQNDPDEKITGTLLFLTSGENYSVSVHPKKVREILDIKPIKIKADEF